MITYPCQHQVVKYRILSYNLMTYRNKKNLKIDRELSLIISDGPDKSFSVMRIGTLRSTTRQPRRRSVNMYK